MEKISVKNVFNRPNTESDKISDYQEWKTKIYKKIFDSSVIGIMVIDQNFRISDYNRKLLEFHNCGEIEKNVFCYHVIPETPRETPCPECLIRKTFVSGKEMNQREQINRPGESLYLNTNTLPVFNDLNEVVSVVQISEDITQYILNEQKLQENKKNLENEISNRISEQHQKEQKLTVLVNTVNVMKTAQNTSASMEKLCQGFFDLDARDVIFTLIEDENMYIARIFPDETYKKLKEIFSVEALQLHLNPWESPVNPFSHTMLVGKPVFFWGEGEMYGFFKSLFPTSFEHSIAEAAYFFNGRSAVIFPLKTKDTTVGTITTFSEAGVLEQNFEYYSFLANSAAVEIHRQQSREKLYQSELKYRNLVENSRDMIILCNRDGKIKYSNSAFNLLSGMIDKKKKNTSIYTFFAGPSRSSVKGIVTDCVQNGIITEPMEIQMTFPNKKRLWTEIVVNTIQDEISGFQIVARDINQRKNLELLVGNLSAFQEKILQNDVIGIITMDLDGNITSWNRGASNILGFTSQEMLEKNIGQFLSRDERGKSGGFPDKEKTSSLLKNREVKFRKKDGNSVDIQYFESAMKDDADRPVAIVAFFFDNTEKMKLEAKRKELTFRLQQAQLITIVSLAKLTEYRDIETGQHLERIMKYTELLARELTSFKEYKNYISDEYIIDLVNSCPLHDIGKVGIPDSILHKPARLTTDEFEVIKKHSVIGGDTIAEAERKIKGRSYLNLGKEIAYYHHERWDGKGYPEGLKGKKIPLSARIVAIADVYDALISKRPYKEPYPHKTAVKIINYSAESHFDKTIVQAFMSCENVFDELANSTFH